MTRLCKALPETTEHESTESATAMCQVALDEKWRATISSTDDLDVKADYGNDLMQLHILQEGFEQAAVKAFGPGVKEFSREPLLVTTPTRGVS